MTQRNEETLSAGWHPDRKSSEDSFLDIMGPSQIALTETRSPKRKDKTKASLFSSKRAGDYKVAYENEMEINSERAGSTHKLAVKPINSFETQPSRFDGLEKRFSAHGAPKIAEQLNCIPLLNKQSQYEITEEEEDAPEKQESTRKVSDENKEEEEDQKGLEEQLALLQKLDQEQMIKKGGAFQTGMAYGALRRVRSLPEIHSEQSFKDQLKEIELNQDLNNIQAFAPYRNKHLADYQTEIELYINKAITRDRRHLGALIGAGVLGVVGFFVLSSLTVVGGIAGGVVAGVGIGRMAGRCLKRKLNLAKLDVGSVVQIRMMAMLRWAKSNRKKLTIEKFSSILEKLIFETKQCQQINQAKPKKVKAALKAVRKFLLSRKSQIALLYYTGNFEKELNDHSDANAAKNFERFVYQVFYIIIPLIRILDLENTPQHRDLEVYRRCVTLLEDEDLVQILHEFIQKENLNIIPDTVEMTPFADLTLQHKSFSAAQTPQRYSKPERQDEVEKNEIKKMLTFAVQEPALITPMERRLNHQILEEASKIEEKRLTLRRRNSDPPQIVNIQEANDIRMKKKQEEMNQLRRFILQNSPIINPNSIQIEIDPTRRTNAKIKFITRFDAIQACKPSHGDIYDEPLPTEYDDDDEEEEGPKEEEEQKSEDLERMNSEQSLEDFKAPENIDVPDNFHKLYKIAKQEGEMWHRVLQDEIIVVYRKKVRCCITADKK